MSREEFIREHRKLLKTLKRPTKRKLAEEKREQSKEVKSRIGNRKPAYIA